MKIKMRLNDYIKLCYATVPIKQKWAIFVKYNLHEIFKIDFEAFKKEKVRMQILRQIRNVSYRGKKLKN